MELRDVARQHFHLAVCTFVGPFPLSVKADGCAHTMINMKSLQNLRYMVQDGPSIGRDSGKTQGAVDREISKLQKQMRNMVTC